MSTTARLVLAALVVLGASLFVYALTMPEPEESPREPNGSTEEAKVDPGRPADEGVLDGPENCRECHAQIYAEWEQDRHSQAWVGALFTEKSQNHADSSCWSCHAPRPILETGLDSPAEARTNFRESGINCLSCHKRGDRVVGETKDPSRDAACGPVFDPAFPADRPDMQEATIAYCGVCHNLHGTDKEFRGSVYYREGKTCLSCHMSEKVMAPIVNGGEPRLRRVHRFPGGHSREMLRTAMKVTAERSGDKVVARVVNEGAGHRVPTDARHRAIRLRIAFFDEYGQPVAVQDPATGTAEREITLDLIRLFYRQEQKPDTQIVPKGTLGRDNWRESEIAIPEGAAKGRARLRLYYNLSPYAPVEKGTLVHELEVPLG